MQTTDFDFSSVLSLLEYMRAGNFDRQRHEEDIFLGI